jgi:excinuclease ABC subunit A
VLDMPIEEAAGFFEPVPAIHRHLKTLVDVGLGYVRLGQPRPPCPAARHSGSSSPPNCSAASTGRTIYVLDEPTTGCTSRTSASCSACSAGWSTAATRSS